MALSRTARILIAVLLLAAAGFFWLNFFQQNEAVDTSPTPTPATTSGAAAPLTSGPVTPGTSANGIATTPDETPADGGVASTEAPSTAGEPGGDDQGEAAGSPPVAITPGAPATASDDPAAPVTLTDPPAVVLRDLVVEPLPFLVTEPPMAAEEGEAEDPDAAGRAISAVRANVNPFSPILVQAPPAQAQPIAEAPAPVTSSEPEIVVVEGDPQPTGTTPASVARTPVAAPAPRAVAPASSRTSELPRPLPSGTLTAVPDILRDARTQPSAASGPANLGTVAALSVPTEGPGAELPFASSEGRVDAATSPEPIGPGRVSAEAAPEPGVVNSLPVAIGADALSRYLRDNNVRFTGQVLGPLSVGVFRSNLYQQPAVVMLGQTLPDSEILLSDLRGYEARFTLGQNTQVLSLDTRR